MSTLQHLIMDIFILLCILPFWLLMIEAKPVQIDHTFDLCQDTRLDAAVSLDEGRLLILKGPLMWLLFLDEYRVDPPMYNNSTINACLEPNMAKSLAGEPYYIWNRHGDFKYYRHQICIDRSGEICQLSFDLSTIHSEAMSRKKVPIIQITSNNMDSCDTNVRGQEITLMLSSKVYHEHQPKVTKSILLVGKYFKAYVRFDRSSPYDNDRFLFKVELMKFDREVNPAGDCEESSVDSNEDPTCLKDVYTFVNLPGDQLIVFFAEEFCYLSFFDLKCGRRSLRDLFGCTMPSNKTRTILSIESIESSARRVVKVMNLNETSANSSIMSRTISTNVLAPNASLSPSSMATESSVPVAKSISSGVSTLASEELTTRPPTTTISETNFSIVPSSTTRSSVSLSGNRLTNLTTADVSIDTNETSTPSSATATPNITTADDKVFTGGIDSLREKRTTFEGMDARQKEARFKQRFDIWPHYLNVGFSTYFLILTRGLALFTVILSSSIGSILLILIFVNLCIVDVNIGVIFIICKNLILAKLADYL